jgi:carbonic anhydrase
MIQNCKNKHMDLDKVFENNENWVKEKLDLDENYFENLSKGQSPELLYIGCSDSRVTAEELMGAAPGEVFVHRNIANMVTNLDLSSASVVNYGADKMMERP